MNLKKISRTGSDEIYLEWSDGHAGPVGLGILRDTCPCAGCKGETILFESYKPPPPDRSTPGRYQLKGAEPIGTYAMKFLWGDGHDQGLYTWQHLRALCSCEECRTRKGLPGKSA